MKTLAILFLALIVATSQGAPSVRVLRAGDAAEAVPEFHVWGGRSVELALEITATDPAQRVNVRANLDQLASSISASLGENLPVAQELAFNQSLARFEKWKVTLPAVRYATNVEVRFDAQSGAGENWQPAGTARLVLYPTNFDEQLKKVVVEAEQREIGRLAVFGHSAQLKAALQQLGVTFEDLGDSLPGHLDKSLIYLGECKPEDLRDINGRGKLPGRLIVFADDPAALPGVYWTDHSRGFLAKVTLPIWQDFGHSPQRQSAFFELLQRIFKTSLNP